MVRRLNFKELKPRSRPRYKERRRCACNYCGRRQYAEYGKPGQSIRLKNRPCIHCGADPRHTGRRVLRTVDWTRWKELGDMERLQGAQLRRRLREAGIEPAAGESRTGD